MKKDVYAGITALILGAITYWYLNNLWFKHNPMISELANSEFKDRFFTAKYLLTGGIAGLVCGLGGMKRLSLRAFRLLIGTLPLVILCVGNIKYLITYIVAVLITFAISFGLNNGTEHPHDINY